MSFKLHLWTFGNWSAEFSLLTFIYYDITIYYENHLLFYLKPYINEILPLIYTGMSALQAFQFHTCKLGILHDLSVAANRSINPNINAVQLMCSNWARSKHGDTTCNQMKLLDTTPPPKWRHCSLCTQALLRLAPAMFEACSQPEWPPGVHQHPITRGAGAAGEEVYAWPRDVTDVAGEES